MLMMMAREYVTVNPTMFFGPSPTQPLDPDDDVPSATGFTAVRMAMAGGALAFLTELPLDPTGFNRTGFTRRTRARGAPTRGVPGVEQPR
jgi:hypothetical protein